VQPTPGATPRVLIECRTIDVAKRATGLKDQPRSAVEDNVGCVGVHGTEIVALASRTDLRSRGNGAGR
jgi:hypothetical protein